MVSKVQNRDCKTWEGSVRHLKAFNMGPDRSTADGVWRQAVMAALVDDTGEAARAPLRDVKQCHEHVGHEQ
eukprot:4251886-Pyramimonas_sp.AAC.1